MNNKVNNSSKKGFWQTSDFIIAKLYRFIKYNKYWGLTFKALFLSAFYRICILLVKPKKLQKYWGVEGEESAEEDTIEAYRYAYKVSYAVDRVCTRTSWESKCLVRALTAQHILKKKKISSTMYLGCKLEDGQMVAHAWLRVGKMYVTGGRGDGYSIVDKFRT